MGCRTGRDQFPTTCCCVLVSLGPHAITLSALQAVDTQQTTAANQVHSIYLEFDPTTSTMDDLQHQPFFWPSSRKLRPSDTLTQTPLTYLF
jgi:hypothetical protein